MAYPMEFRRLVAAAYDACGSSSDVAEQYGCSESWVRRLIQRRRATGSLAPRPARRPDTALLKEDDLAELAALIARKPDMTLEELAAALTKKVSISTVHRAAEKIRNPLKKSPSTRPNSNAPTCRRRVPSGSKASAT
jgi:transposase